MVEDQFERSVFVNCPFDRDYEPILQAILFCLVRFGLVPRIATEQSNAGEPRIEKIQRLIEASRFSIHDLSRCQSREVGEHYRMNMPFELGIDFGCRRYGGGRFVTKTILILEEKPYRYQIAISDLAGSDIAAHDGDYGKAVRKVRNWLTGMGGFEQLGASRILSEYEDFQEWQLERQRENGFSEDDIREIGTPELLSGMLEWTRRGRPRS